MPEERRKKVIAQLQSRDFDKEKELEGIVKVAAQICNTPIALITFLDEQTQWIRVRTGTDVTQVPLEIAFCRVTFTQREVLVVPDLSLDTRFDQNPLVVSEPNLRFYAGAPLITEDGLPLGSLCVIDHAPKHLTEQQQDALSFLSRQVMHILQLELHVDMLHQKLEEIERQKNELIESENKLRSFFESTNSIHLLLDETFAVIAFNKAASRFILEAYGKMIESRHCIREYFSAAIEEALMDGCAKARSGERVYFEQEVGYDKLGAIWWAVTLMPALNASGRIIGVSFHAKNINERKQYELKIVNQNKALLEIADIQSHEFRRPVASIMGLLQLIRENDYEDSKELLLLMEEAVGELDVKIHEINELTYPH